MSKESMLLSMALAMGAIPYEVEPWSRQSEGRRIPARTIEQSPESAQRALDAAQAKRDRKKAKRAKAALSLNGADNDRHCNSY